MRRVGRGIEVGGRLQSPRTSGELAVRDNGAGYSKCRNRYLTRGLCARMAEGEC